MNQQLTQFAGAYFHQDYDLEYSGADEAIRDFGDEEPASVRGLLDEIDRLLASPATETELADLWDKELDAFYIPTDDGQTYRDWFAHVRELLQPYVETGES